MKDRTCSSTTSGNVSNGNVVVATGDNFGRLRLYRFPVTSALAKCKDYRGHSNIISKVRWAAGASHLLTVSAHDRAVFQWAHIIDDIAEEELEARIMANTGQTDAISTKHTNEAAAEVLGISGDGSEPAPTGNQLAADIDAMTADLNSVDDDESTVCVCNPKE